MSLTKYITVNLNPRTGMFSAIFNKFKYSRVSDVATVRKIFSNEKARLIHTIKIKNPNSIYELAKILQRDFKSVVCDVKLLEGLGIIKLVHSHVNGRQRLRPVIGAIQVSITINL